MKERTCRLLLVLILTLVASVEMDALEAVDNTTPISTKVLETSEGDNVESNHTYVEQNDVQQNISLHNVEQNDVQQNISFHNVEQNHVQQNISIDIVQQNNVEQNTSLNNVEPNDANVTNTTDITNADQSDVELTKLDKNNPEVAHIVTDNLARSPDDKNTFNPFSDSETNYQNTNIDPFSTLETNVQRNNVDENIAYRLNELQTNDHDDNVDPFNESQPYVQQNNHVEHNVHDPFASIQVGVYQGHYGGHTDDNNYDEPNHAPIINPMLQSLLEYFGLGVRKMKLYITPIYQHH
mgnify:CR=1 FL=1